MWKDWEYIQAAFVWKDWEYIQAAFENWHYASQAAAGVSDEAGHIRARQVVLAGKFALLAQYAEQFALSENPYVGKDALATLAEWIGDNRQGCRDWLKE